MRLSERTRKILHLVALPLAIASVATIVSYRVVETTSSQASFADVLDTQKATSMRGPAPAYSDIELITYDETTLKNMGLENASFVPRSIYADLITKLDKAGARVALFDVAFAGDTKGTDALKSSLEHLRHMDVTLATYTEPGKAMDFSGPVVSGPLYRLGPSSDYQSNRLRVGSVDSETTSLGNIRIGGYPIEIDSNSGKQLLYAPFSAALQYYGIPASNVQVDEARGRVTAGPLQWGLDESHAINARWTTTAMPFPHMDLVQAMKLLDHSPNGFAGKLVIVGYRGDLKDTSDMGTFGTTHGIDFVAQMTNTILLGAREQFLRAPDPVLYGFAVLVSFAGFLAIRGRRPVLGVVSVVLLVGVCFAAQRWFAATMDWRLGVTAPILAMGATCLSSMLIGRYWTDHVNLSPPKESEDATVMFLDIRSSTRMLHDMGREEFLRFFADLMSVCGPLVKECGGQIEHMLGDGFMAVFRSDGRRHHALRCADCCDRLAKAGETLAKRKGIPFKLALGFESGIVGGGYVSEGGKKSWSSTGTTVHLAQRLQTLCGQLDLRIAVGPVARRLIADEKSCEMITKAYVKGFEEEVEVCGLC